MTISTYNSTASRTDVQRTSEDERKRNGAYSNSIDRWLQREVYFVIHIDRPHPASTAALAILGLLTLLVLLAAGGVIRPHDGTTLTALATTLGTGGTAAALLAAIAYFERRKKNDRD